MCFDEDCATATARANLEAGAMIGERVLAIFILECHGNVELGVRTIAVIAIANLSEQGLLPLVPVPFAGIGIVEIFDAVAEGVQGQSEAPLEDICRATRPRDHRRIARRRDG